MAKEFDFLDTLAPSGAPAAASETPEAGGIPQASGSGIPGFGASGSGDALSPQRNDKPADPMAAEFERLYGSVPAEQLDPDTLGLVTAREGQRLGTGWGRDTVRGLNLYGTAVPYETLQGVEGGNELISLASKAREGSRGFVEALTTGSWTDFVPYLGDLATWGVSIRNMKTVRDSLQKMQKEGPEALTLQEKVLTKLYTEDMQRESQQSWGGTVGSIMRQSPAFAFEFLTTGGLFKMGSAALGHAGKEAMEAAVRKEMRKVVSDKLFEASQKPLFKRELLKAADLGLDEAADGVLKAKAAAVLGTEAASGLKAAALDAAETYVAAYKNPSAVRAIGNFLTEYGKRGFFDHLDEMVRDLPPSVMGKLREAAGVAFVEAPVKGALYAAFDFLAVNPVAAAVAGSDEAVTRTELGIQLSGNEDAIRHAKMLAFGSAWAQYAGEFSGRAFNAAAGTVLENAAGQIGRATARRGLRATSGFEDQGSFVRLFSTPHTVLRIS